MDEKINFLFDIWESLCICSATCNCTVVRKGQPDLVADKVIVVIEDK